MDFTINFTLGSWSIMGLWLFACVAMALCMKGNDYEEKVSKPFILPLSRILFTALFIDMVFDPDREVWEHVIAYIYLFLQLLEIVDLFTKWLKG